jgi:hypothetical protein
MFDKVVLVTRETPLLGLRKRYGTVDQAQFVLKRAHASIDQYKSFHSHYQTSLEQIRKHLPAGVRVAEVDYNFISTYQFDPKCLVITVGADGLVVNVAKYLDGQPIFAVNPDPTTIDGVLARNAPHMIEQALSGKIFRRTYYTMAEARLDDGQVLHAFNDFFVGQSSHQSARYTISQGDRSERHSSSGVIISTGAGSTGWYRSVLSGVAGVLSYYGEGESAEHLRQNYQFPCEERSLRFAVREPFPSKATQAYMTYGRIEEGEELVLSSEMPAGGVIFSDGIESDYLTFTSGMTARIGVSQKVTELWTAF